MTAMNQKGSDPPKRVEKCLFCGYTLSSVTAEVTKALSIQKPKPVMKSTRATKQFNINKPIAVGMLTLGLVFLIPSVFYSSYVPAFVGLGLAFWGALLLYVTPAKHIRLDLLNATLGPALSNTERMLANAKLDGKGVYLPPRYLKNSESSLLFVPSKQDVGLPEPEDIDGEEHFGNPTGVFLVPHGAALSRIFEDELGTSFTATDLSYIQEKLPKLLVEDLEMAESMEIKIEDNTVTMEITNHVFNEICLETSKLPKTQRIMGCPLASAIACALAKATGKPVVIEKEEQSQDGKTTEIRYRLMEE